ncbi:MAG: transposase [Treponema sp.]|jgi:hypothetical protein|nr:transposase [Treponema sp.]
MTLRYAIGNGISNSIPLDAGLGYLGIEQYHANSFIPVKSSKNHQLTKQEKAYNKRLSRRRIVIEHINGRIKTFRCMSYPYLWHYHNRHTLRMALICGFVNYDRKIWDIFRTVCVIGRGRYRSGCLRRFASPDKGFAQQRPGPAKCAAMRRGKERSD